LLALEVGLVLAVSYGHHGVYALLDLINLLMQPGSLADQPVDMNYQITYWPWLDLLYQLARFAFALAPAALAIYLLATRPFADAHALSDAGPNLALLSGPKERAGQDVWSRLGLDPGRRLGKPFQDGEWAASDTAVPSPQLKRRSEALRDLRRAVLLAAGIGLPGLAFFWLGRQMGITADVSTSSLGGVWWTVPVLVLAAFAAGAGEEIVVVGYVVTRLETIGLKPWTVLAFSAVLRGSYHLYQGIGPFIGNVVMGLVFGAVFMRWRRVAPLIGAHWLMDIVAFVGPLF